MIYVTSDLHLNHDRDFIWGTRGFNNIYEHDKAIIQNWNSIITDDDEVWILGDLMLGDNEVAKKSFNQLCGLKHIILGNHDTDSRVELYPQLRGVVDMWVADQIKYGNKTFYLSHYPTEIGLRKNFYNLCGHIHTKDKWLGYEQNHNIHIEMDCRNMTPVSLEQIYKEIKNKDEH